MTETLQTAADRARWRIAELEILAEYLAEIAQELVEPEVAAFVCRKAGQICDESRWKRRPCAVESK